MGPPCQVSRSTSHKGRGAALWAAFFSDTSMVNLRIARGTGIGGAIVRFGTWSNFAHVGFKLDDGKVLDAVPELGVSIRDAEDDGSTEYWKILAPKQHIDGMIEWGKTQIGKKYDWGGIY